MKLSIIIPVYNEEKTIVEILRRVKEAKMGGVDKEIIVVDDGSTDSTVEKLKNKNLKGVKIILQEKNRGKGSAVIAGIKKATGDYIIIQDADLEYDPRIIERLLKPILGKKAKVVYGTRLKRMPHLNKEERKPRFLLHYFGNRALSLATSILYQQWITDMETCYKLFPRSALDDITLKSKGFEFDPEITVKLMKKGFSIVEVPIETNPRDYDEGKKLNTFRDGSQAVWTIVKYRFSD